MAGKTRYATVHYRKLDSSAGLPLPLADAIGQALDAVSDGVRYRDDWHRRVETLATDPPQRRFINHVHSDGLTTFGTLCAYTEQQMQALINTGPGAASADVPVSDFRAPTDSDYLHGIAYWLIIANHCYVVQHPRVTSKALEQYLTWLLRNASILNDTQTVVLCSDFDLSLVGGDPDDVTSIRVGGSAPETLADHDGIELRGRDVEERRSVGHIRRTFSKASKVLDALFGELDARSVLNDVPEGVTLDVDVDITYRSTKRKFDRSSLRAINTRLRNLDDGDLRIRGRNGSAHGNDARLHMNMPFKLVRQNGSLLDLPDVRAQLRKVHDRFLEDGKITDGE